MKKEVGYDINVFVNCPFDEDYKPLRDAIIFALFHCKFFPRCALEHSDSGMVRLDKIQKLIAESKYGIHDLSRTELDGKTGLPRFNMPLELGLFLGAKRFGAKEQKAKASMVFDSEAYRYQAFVSDLAGCDFHAHKNDPKQMIRRIRDWLASTSKAVKIPGGDEIIRRYSKFHEQLPEMCREAKIGQHELTYNDFTNFIAEWLKANS